MTYYVRNSLAVNPYELISQTGCGSARTSCYISDKQPPIFPTAPFSHPRSGRGSYSRNQALHSRSASLLLPPAVTFALPQCLSPPPLYLLCSACSTSHSPSPSGVSADFLDHNWCPGARIPTFCSCGMCLSKKPSETVMG